MQLLFDKERGDVSPGETCSSEAKRNRAVNLASCGKFLTVLQFVWNGSNSDSNLSSAARLQLFCCASDRNLFSTFRAQVVRRSELMILALISIACFSDVSNSLQAMLICARISNAFGTDAFFSSWREFRISIELFLFCFTLWLSGLKWTLWNKHRATEETQTGSPGGFSLRENKLEFVIYITGDAGHGGCICGNQGAFGGGTPPA